MIIKIIKIIIINFIFFFFTSYSKENFNKTKTTEYELKTIEEYYKIATTEIKRSKKNTILYTISGLKLLLELKKQNNIKDSEFYNYLLKGYFLIANTLLKHNEYSKAIKYYLKANKIAKKLNNYKGICISYNNIGVIYFNTGNFEKALENYKHTLYYAIKIKDTISMSSALLNIANINFQIGNYEKSYKYFLKALKISQDVKDSIGLSMIYNNIGNIYIKLENYEKALEYFEQSNKINEHLGNYEHLITNYLNQANIFLLKKNISIAEYFCQKALNLARNLKNKKTLSDVYYSYGLIKMYEEKLDTAEYFFNISLFYKKIVSDSSNIANIKNKLSYLCIKKNKIDLASKYAYESSIYAKEKNTPEILKESYLNLYEIFKIKKNYKKALEYYRLYKSINDSILGEENKKKIKELEIKFDSEKKQREIEKLKLQQQKSEFYIIKLKYQKNLFLIIAIISTLFAIILSCFLYVIKKQNDKIKTLNKNLTEKEYKLEILNSKKDKFFSVISHELKEPISIIYMYATQINNNIESFNFNELKTFYFSLLKYIEKLMELTDNLIHWAKLETSSYNIKLEKVNLNECILEVIQREKDKIENKKININYNFKESYFILGDKNMLYFVLKNLLNNAIKFSHNNSNIEISIKEREDNKILLNIIDYGIGMKEDELNLLFNYNTIFSKPGTNKEKGTGLGLILSKEFIEKMGGEIKIESKYNTGTKVLVSFNKYIENE